MLKHLSALLAPLLAFAHTVATHAAAQAPAQAATSSLQELENSALSFRHTRPSRLPRGTEPDFDVNGFAHEVRLNFLTADIVQLVFFQYSPSIGGRTARSIGRYAFNPATQEVCLRFLNEGTDNSPHISLNGRRVQWSAYVFGHLVLSPVLPFGAIDKVPAAKPSRPGITELAPIAQFCFKQKQQIGSSNLRLSLRLIDVHQQSIEFGESQMTLQPLSERLFLE